MSEQQAHTAEATAAERLGHWPRRDRSHRDGARRRRAAGPAFRSAGEVLEPRDERHPDRGAAEVVSRARAQARIGRGDAAEDAVSDDATRPAADLGRARIAGAVSDRVASRVGRARSRDQCQAASGGVHRAPSAAGLRPRGGPPRPRARRGAGRIPGGARGGTARLPLRRRDARGAPRRGRSRPGDRRTSPRRSSRRWRRATTACSPSIR